MKYHEGPDECHRTNSAIVIAHKSKFENAPMVSERERETEQGADVLFLLMVWFEYGGPY